MATFTEQLMCRAQVRSADSALYLKPNTTLCPSPSIIIPHISLLSSVVQSPCILSSSILHPEQSSADEMTSSIANHPACHRSMLILPYPLVRHTGSMAHDLTHFLTPSLTRCHILLFLSSLLIFTHSFAHSFSYLMLSFFRSSPSYLHLFLCVQPRATP